MNPLICKVALAVSLALVLQPLAPLFLPGGAAAQNIEQERFEMVAENRELLENLSKEEQHWYRKFQDGIMLFSGWEEISAEILHALPPEKRPHTSKLLDALGIRIGTEWSKDNAVRRIDTEMLRSWGKLLRKARKSGPQQLLAAVRTVASEVEMLLEGQEERPAEENFGG